MNTQKYHVKSTWDHWWPKSIQRLWLNEKKHVVEISNSGSTRSRQPKKTKQINPIGALLGGHRVDLKGPWSHTFERDFSIDSSAGGLLREIENTYCFRRNITFSGVANIFIRLIFGSQEERSASRIITVDTSKVDLQKLLRVVFSLMVRSPQFRFKRSQVRFGPLAGNQDKAEKFLGPSNVRDAWQSLWCLSYDSVYKVEFTFAFSDSIDFVYGDSCLDSAFDNWETLFQTEGCSEYEFFPVLNGEVLISLTPRMALYLKIVPRISRENYFSARSMLVFEQEVDEINMITSICSRRFLFGRSEELLKGYYHLLGEHQRVDGKTSRVLQTLRAQSELC